MDTNDNESPTRQELLAATNERLSDWGRRAKQWYFAYYALGLIAVLLTITVASQPHFLSKHEEWTRTIAWLAAIFQGLSTFLVAFPKATAYRTAFRTLWLARFDYVNERGNDDSAQQLRQAIRHGWAVIDGGYVDAFRAASRTVQSGARTKSRQAPG